MDMSHFSPVVTIVTTDQKQQKFYKNNFWHNPLPCVEDLYNLKAIVLSYGYCGEQAIGMSKVFERFCINNQNIVTASVSELHLYNDAPGNYVALMYGAVLDDIVKSYVKDSGIIGYWDSESFGIFSTNTYKSVVEKIYFYILSKKAKMFNNGGSFAIEI